jgi:hypothetical protein
MPLLSLSFFFALLDICHDFLSITLDGAGELWPTHEGLLHHALHPEGRFFEEDTLGPRG